MADEKAKEAFAVGRRAKDDTILEIMTAELDAFERATGKTVDVTVKDSTDGGNCEAGVVAWRKKNAGGRASVPAREMLQIAAEGRDQVSRVVLGIRRAIARMKSE